MNPGSTEKGLGWQWRQRTKTLRQLAVNQAGLNPDAVFIWIPKSAGTSVYGALEELGCAKFTDVPRAKRAFAQSGLVTFGHMDYRQLVSSGVVSEKYDAKSKKFTIVRNPYDRAISLYLYIRDRHRHFHNWRIQPSFEDFLDIIDHGHFDQIGLFNFKGMSQANPQVAWTKGIDLDFVGKLENLEESMAGITDLLGRPLAPPQWLNKADKSGSGDLLSRRATYLIEKVYEEDFQAFDYAQRA